jgi:hypothetical protein
MLEEPPDTYRVYVPLTEGACSVSLRLLRDRGGERCAVGFTRLDRMTELLGSGQPCYRLTVRAVRELAAERGVTRLILDPALVAAPVRDPGPLPQLAVPAPAPAAAHRAHHPLRAARTAWEHSQAAGILVVSAGAGAAALVLEALR